MQPRHLAMRASPAQAALAVLARGARLSSAQRATRSPGHPESESGNCSEYKHLGKAESVSLTFMDLMAS